MNVELGFGMSCGFDAERAIAQPVALPLIVLTQRHLI